MARWQLRNGAAKVRLKLSAAYSKRKVLLPLCSREEAQKQSSKLNIALPKMYVTPPVNAFGRFSIDGAEQTVLADAEQTGSCCTK